MSSENNTESAVEAVLNTTELFELILLNLPIKDLLFSQRVCVRWCAVIKRSTILQKALFLEPATDQVASFHSQLWTSAPDVIKLDELEESSFFYLCSPSTLELVASFETTRIYSDRLPYNAETLVDPKIGKIVERRHARMEQLKHGIRNNITKTRVFINPLLEDTFNRLHRAFYRQKFDWKAKVSKPKLVHLRQPFLEPSASWRRMFITQPPVGMLGLDSADELPGRSVRLRDGNIGSLVTMQVLWERRNKSELKFSYVKDIFGDKRTERLELWSGVQDLAKIGKGLREENAESEGKDEGEETSGADD